MFTLSTDADMAINALDSAAPPVTKRVRKSRAKPPAKNITPMEQNTENKTMEEKEKTETPTKKSRHSVDAFHLRRHLFGRTLVEDRAATPTLTIEEKLMRHRLSPRRRRKKLVESTNDTGVGEEQPEQSTEVKKKKRKRKSSCHCFHSN
ncbi:hypothetical protein F7725_028425 [Dissostichus mawsoni]|uniref:Uncharacterized protein n=1 Tax=Dissostichus mawsoni TaxID=36200 RepID=A0A7J5XGV7_DISMA|nr:hypothetical protein F7725_028425 [Dissostichus mawsoni]